MTGSKQALGNTDTERSREAYEFISAKRCRPWQGEEEVWLAWVSALEAALGIHFDAERAKKDSSYFNVIIEFKAPRIIQREENQCQVQRSDGCGRLLPYIQREAKKSGIPQDDYIGIAIDGDHICFVQVVDNVIHTQHLIPFSEYAVGLVIQAIKAHTRRAKYFHQSSDGRFSAMDQINARSPDAGDGRCIGYRACCNW